MYRLPKIDMYTKTLAEIKDKNMPVAVFGIGRLGKMTIGLLKDFGIEIAFIFDNNIKHHGTCYEGIEIRASATQSNKEVYVIITVFDFMKDIEQQIKSEGYSNVLPYYCCFHGQEISSDLYWENDGSIQEAVYLAQKSKHDENYLYINSLDIVITEKCSLKCKNCANLNQYYKKPKDEDHEFMSMERLFSCIDLVGRISIMGGEPLVCQKVTDYVKECKKYPNICNILVVSNGTIMPYVELTDTIKKDDRCLLSVSDYGELSKEKGRIIQDSVEKGYKICISRRVEGIWRELGRIEYLNMTESELEEKWNLCMMKKYLMLKEGKLFICPFAANGYALRAFDRNDINFINLADESVSLEELKGQIKEFLNMKSHKVCKYCIERGKYARLIPAAEQTRTPLEYKKYDF